MPIIDQKNTTTITLTLQQLTLPSGSFGNLTVRWRSKCSDGCCCKIGSIHVICFGEDTITLVTILHVFFVDIILMRLLSIWFSLARLARGVGPNYILTGLIFRTGSLRCKRHKQTGPTLSSSKYSWLLPGACGRKEITNTSEVLPHPLHPGLGALRRI
mgnify:CR=1 FL=1